MYCLYCGDCCLRMSPISNPCPHIIEKATFVFCSAYEIRPEQCEKHRHPFRFCPIGVEKLGLTTSAQIALRIDTGWEIISNA